MNIMEEETFVSAVHGHENQTEIQIKKIYRSFCVLHSPVHSCLVF
jgi:hypothetical protein